MRIGILTGGGDVPGLNPCIKTLVTRAADNGWEAVGLRRGWAGPLNIDLGRPAGEQQQWAETLTPQSVRTIDRSGGTWQPTGHRIARLAKPGQFVTVIGDAATPGKSKEAIGTAFEAALLSG